MTKRLAFFVFGLLLLLIAVAYVLACERAAGSGAATGPVGDGLDILRHVVAAPGSPA